MKRPSMVTQSKTFRQKIYNVILIQTTYTYGNMFTEFKDVVEAKGRLLLLVFQSEQSSLGRHYFLGYIQLRHWDGTEKMNLNIRNLKLK